jgi:hypothetical protein
MVRALSRWWWRRSQQDRGTTETKPSVVAVAAVVVASIIPAAWVTFAGHVPPAVTRGADVL